MRYQAPITILVLLLVLLTLPVHAEPYLEIGASLHEKGWARPGVHMNNPLGFWEVGYQHNRYGLWLRHQSSIGKDRGFGITEVGASVRLTLDDLPWGGE